MGCGSYLASSVLCPFFKEDKPGKRIVCEGVLDRTTLAISFGTSKEWNNYTAMYCCKRYEHCKIFKLVNQKYD